MPHSKKHTDTFRHPHALESLRVLNSIDIGKVRELHGKKADSIVAEFNIHRQELRNIAKNPGAIEKYLPTLQMFQKRVEMLLSGGILPPRPQVDTNSGFKHVTSDELKGARIVDSRPGNDSTFVTRVYLRGWTAENMMIKHKTR